MRPRTVTALLALGCAAVACAGLGLSAARATAVFHDLAETGRPGYLTLALDSSTPLSAELAPGDSMRWLVEASLHDADSGTLEVELRADGALLAESGMTAEVAACSGAFDIAAVPASCEGSLAPVLSETPLAQVSPQAGRYALADLRRDDPRQLLVTLAIPASTPPSALEGRTARIGLGVHAAGEGPAVVRPVGPTPRDGLPVTGADVAALGLLAAGLAGLGAVAALRGRGRGRRASHRGGAR